MNVFLKKSCTLHSRRRSAPNREMREDKRSGPTCPHCKAKRSYVYDTRSSGDDVRRRRQCECGKRFTTLEVVAIPPVEAKNFKPQEYIF